MKDLYEYQREIPREPRPKEEPHEPMLSSQANDSLSKAFRDLDLIRDAKNPSWLGRC